MGGEVQRPDALGLVHLAVAEERPHPLLRGVLQPPVQQVAVEAGLVDGVDAGEAHRHRRELPEGRHEARVRVRGEPRTQRLPAEVIEVVLGDPALEIGAGVDAGGGVALEEDLVATAGVVLAAEEVVEADLVEARRRGIRGEVAAEADVEVVGPGDHDRRVPADDAADLQLELLVAREVGLLLRRDAVDVVGLQERRQADLALAGEVEDAGEEVPGALAALVLEDVVDGRKPFRRLVGVGVRELVPEHFIDQRCLAFFRALGGRGRGRREAGCSLH